MPDITIVNVTYPYLAESVGLLGLVSVVLAYQHNNRSLIIVFQSLGLLLLAGHLFLIAAPTGVAMLLVSAVRSVLFYFKEYYRWIAHPSTLIVMLALMVGLGIYYWENYISIFAILGTTIGTYAIWLSSPRSIRLVTMVSVFMWVPYAIVNESNMLLLLQTFLAVSIGLAVWRFDIKSSERNS